MTAEVSMPVDDPTLTIARLSRVLENHGTGELSLPQYRVLGLLSDGEQRASLLAARLSVAKPTLTSLVDSLVERGYVTRDALHGDRRAVRLSITPAGRTTLTEAAAHLRGVLDNVLDRCADRDLALAGLAELTRGLDALWAERVAAQPAAVQSSAAQASSVQTGSAEPVGDGR